MPLGGGTFSAQNKILPGTYINFVNVAQNTSSLSDRGVVAIGLPLNWGGEEKIISATATEFQENAMGLFGYPYSAPEMQELRELFLHARQAYIYNLNSGGTAAANDYATAKYPGTRGNDIAVSITSSENSTENNLLYDVTLHIAGALVFEQRGVSATAELADNAYVTWNGESILALTAGVPLADGDNGALQEANHQDFLDKMESYAFNILACVSDDDTIKALYANYTKRMRNDVGVKFQCVLHQYAADHEGVISVENTPNNIDDNYLLVCWTAGSLAAVALNESLGNKIYDGEHEINVDYTQTQLEEALKSGKFIYHQVNDTVRVLEDINTLVNYTSEKDADFASNQTIRVIDQIGKDVAALFSNKYLGQVPNDSSGRISLWNDILKIHNDLVTIRAIEAFDSDKLKVEQGANKKAVVVTDSVTIINAMSQLYMTLIIS